MSDAAIVNTSRPTDPIGKVLDAISRLFAVCSGLILAAMSLMSVYSIIGRSFFDKV